MWLAPAGFMIVLVSIERPCWWGLRVATWVVWPLVVIVLLILLLDGGWGTSDPRRNKPAWRYLLQDMYYPLTLQ
jgi:hypothetical protein